MTASFPAGFKAFPLRRDNQDVVYADHVNGMQDEIVAIEKTLGINPHIAVADMSNNVSAPDTVTDRLTMLELNYQRAILSWSGTIASLPNNVITPVTNLALATNSHGLTVNTSSGVMTAGRIGLADAGWWQWSATVFWRWNSTSGVVGDRSIFIEPEAGGNPLASDTRLGNVPAVRTAEGYAMSAGGLLTLTNGNRFTLSVRQTSGATWGEAVRANLTLLWEREA